MDEQKMQETRAISTLSSGTFHAKDVAAVMAGLLAALYGGVSATSGITQHVNAVRDRVMGFGDPTKSYSLQAKQHWPVA